MSRYEILKTALLGVIALCSVMALIGGVILFMDYQDRRDPYKKRHQAWQLVADYNTQIKLRDIYEKYGKPAFELSRRSALNYEERRRAIENLDLRAAKKILTVDHAAEIEYTTLAVDCRRTIETELNEAERLLYREYHDDWNRYCPRTFF